MKSIQNIEYQTCSGGKKEYNIKYLGLKKRGPERIKNVESMRGGWLKV